MEKKYSGIFKGLTIIVFFSFLISGCAGVKVDDYRDNEPKLVMQDFFNGPLKAHGVVKTRGGRVERYFTADIKASWKDGVGTLDEQFVFDDKERQERVWTITPNPDGSYRATASDVIGIGDLTVSGNSLFLDYVLQIPYNGSDVNVRVDDRMYLVSDSVLINESELTKWGVRVGSLIIVITKH